MLFATRRGVTVSPDSVSYLSAARNLAHGRGLTDFTGQPMTTFPPGLPVLISALLELGIPAVAAMRMVNAVASVFVVLLTWFLLRSRVRTPGLALAGAALVAFAPEFQEVTGSAWSETLFTALLLATVVVLASALSPDQPRPFLTTSAAGVLAGCACMVRYAGIAVVVGGAVAIALVAILSVAVRLRTVLGRLAVFLSTSAVLPVLWTLRNASSGADDVLGPRLPAKPGPVLLAARAVTATAGSLVTPDAPRVVAVMIAILVAVAMLGSVTMLVRHRSAEIAAADVVSMVVLVVLVSYAAVVMGSHLSAGSDLNSRIMAPAAPLVVFCIVSMADRLLLSDRMRAGAVRKWTGAAVLLLVTFAVVGAVVRGVVHDPTADGYADPAPAQRSFVAALGELPHGPWIATNEPYLVAYATGRDRVEFTPGHAEPGLSLRPPSTARLREQACRDGLVIAWLAHSPVSALGPLDDLRRSFGLEVVAKSPGGTVYRAAGDCS